MGTQKQLAEASNSTEAIQIAYQTLKAKSPGKMNASMNAVCTRAGIPSRGYFSMVMNGKRILNKKYGESLARVFRLKEFERDLFLALLNLDHETDSVRKRRLKDAIARYQKLLRLDEPFPFPQDLGANAFIGDVFCSFSFFPKGAEESEVLRLFPQHRHEPVKAAVKKLCREGYLKRDGLKYLVAKKGIIFSASKDKLGPAHYISSSFHETAQVVPALNDYLDSCFLLAITVSLRKADYRQFLADMRKQVMELVAGADDDVGDQLVRVNVGVYPVVPAFDAVELPK